MEDNWNAQATPENPLAPFLDKPIHVLIAGNVLREQVRLTLQALGFKRVTVHPGATGYSQSVQQLGTLLLKVREGLFLVGPPLEAGDKTAGPKEFSDFFADVRIILDKAKRNIMETLSTCVPVFEDIEFVHKREKLVLSLVEFGVSGAFILSKQDPLRGLSPQRKKQLYQQQLKERFVELKGYLDDYLPHMDSSLELVKEKWEERKLTERKAEAEQFLRKAEDLKRTGNFDEAVTALKQAIELLPSDPRAYMESGKVYVRMKKYPSAIKRFQQAEEVALALPEPNKEIGAVRVLQAKELLRGGEPPDSPKILELLNDAADNFGKALLKAEEVKRSDAPDEGEKNVNAVVKIAGDILKLELEDVLGPNHPAVGRFKGMARDSMLLLGGKSTDELPGAQLIFLGQTALDQGNHQAATKYFLKAADLPEFFHAACNEMIYMGQLVRRRKGPAQAIDIYRRLLERNPPNISAVFFNMGVALAESGNDVEAVATLCRGVYIDPELPRNPMFYHNPKLFQAIDHLAWLRSCIAAADREVAEDPALQARGELLEALLLCLARKQPKEGVGLLIQAVQTKGFFQWEFALFDPALQQYLRAMHAHAARSRNPKGQRLGACLERVLAVRQRLTPPEGLPAFKQELFGLLQDLDSGGSSPEVVTRFARLGAAYAFFFQGPNVCSLPLLRNFCMQVVDRMQAVDPSRLKR